MYSPFQVFLLSYKGIFYNCNVFEDALLYDLILHYVFKFDVDENNIFSKNLQYRISTEYHQLYYKRNIIYIQRN